MMKNDMLIYMYSKIVELVINISICININF